MSASDEHKPRALIHKVKASLRSLREKSVPANDNDKAPRIWQLEERLAESERENAALRRKESGDGVSGVKPENMVWIFGSARTGSTWLGAMMEDMESSVVWHEPLVGHLFGGFYYAPGRNNAREGMNKRDFIMGRPHKGSWMNSIRRFILAEAGARFLDKDGYVVVKEPNGSIGAPLIMEALPESRMILLVRDLRDVLSSLKEGSNEGGWMQMRRKKQGIDPEGLANSAPDVFIQRQASSFAQQMGNAKRAYDAHIGPKTLVRYEDLLTDTLAVMRRMYRDLDISVDEEELARVVEKHSWENIPEDEKGEGKRQRKATPGGWREDLTPNQARIVEETTATLMRQFYDDYPNSD